MGDEKRGRRLGHGVELADVDLIDDVYICTYIYVDVSF